MVKNEILASTSILSFLDGEMIKISGLGTDFGVVFVEWRCIRTQIKYNEQKYAIFAISDNFKLLASIEHIRIQTLT